MDFCGGNSSYTTGGGGTSNLPDPKCIPDGINPYYQADYNTQTQPVPDWHYMQNQTWQSVDAWLYSGAKDKNGNPYGIVDYTPLPGAGPINGFAPGTVGPGDLGKIGAQEGAIPGWYFDEVETGWSRLLFLDMGYPIHMSEPTKTINGVKTTFVNEWTDWRDFFNDVGIDYKGPGFPSTAPPASIVVHPSKCGALSQAVTQFTNSGQIPPPGLVQAMKKACGS
jgi:hypothetical protein